jgi:hypothetical protein
VSGVGAVRLFVLSMFLALALPGATVRAADPPSAHKAIQLIYVGAYNCPPCKQWELFKEPAWQKSPEAAQVELRKIMVPFFENTASDSAWPEDLRWVRDRTHARAGTPRFIVVVDRRVVQTSFGIRGWTERVVPLVAELVAKGTVPPIAEAVTHAEEADLPRRD